jgi:hypothetical protein
MKKLILTSLTATIILCSYAQAPFIGTNGGDGLGQYGYLEKDAVTFSRLFRNTYNNIAYLSARWWITDNNAINGNGKEFLYHVYAGPDWVNGIGWQCGGDNDGSKRTTDFIATDFNPEWRAGADCYVSVCVKYCDNSYSPASFDGVSTYGATGFNERRFKVLDVDMSAHPSTATNIPNGNGICETTNAYHVAGSFTITPAAFTGLSISSLGVQNVGTASEVTDIPNAALNLYYEPVTGSEIYGDGNETFGGTLFGNWDGNTSDNVYGNSGLNIPLNTPIRVYVLLCSINTPSGIGKTINLRLINDGISIAPAIDGFSKMRIDPISISNRNITLPIQFLSFNGNRKDQQVQLKWQTIASSIPATFIIQQSIDGTQFTDAATLPSTAFDGRLGNYKYDLSTDAIFFRIIARYNNGKTNSSSILRLNTTAQLPFSIIQNPVQQKIVIQLNSTLSITGQYNIFDAAGKQIITQQKIFTPGINTIEMPASLKSQLLFLCIKDAAGNTQNFKLLKQ